MFAYNDLWCSNEGRTNASMVNEKAIFDPKYAKNRKYLENRSTCFQHLYEADNNGELGKSKLIEV